MGGKAQQWNLNVVNPELEEVAEWIKTEIQTEGRSAENAVISAGFGCFGKNESN